eukprot:c20582_g3_i1.p2 GENE.c20582_g3_i1~~c20582_g3_i1.p2  ORF type:complete len:101 (+),score=18.68 c20582_g3_i1:351-653(+)
MAEMNLDRPILMFDLVQCAHEWLLLHYHRTPPPPVAAAGPAQPPVTDKSKFRLPTSTNTSLGGHPQCNTGQNITSDFTNACSTMPALRRWSNLFQNPKEF